MFCSVIMHEGDGFVSRYSIVTEQYLLPYVHVIDGPAVVYQ